MNNEPAEEVFRRSLEHGSRLSKALTDIQGFVGYGEPSRPCARGVGEILGWFHFEVLEPIESRFPALAGQAVADTDWSPAFPQAENRERAFETFDQVVSESELIALDAANCLSLGADSVDRVRAEVADCRAAARALRDTAADIA